MKAIQGGKAKHDQIDAPKMAVWLRGGMMPQAYVYPAAMRAIRDLLRRRMHLMRQRAELLAPIQHTHRQYNLPAIGTKLADKANRDGVAERFPEPAVHKSMEVDLALINHDDYRFGAIALAIRETATPHHAQTRSRLRPVSGLGESLRLVRLDEIQANGGRDAGTETLLGRRGRHHRLSAITISMVTEPQDVCGAATWCLDRQVEIQPEHVARGRRRRAHQRGPKEPNPLRGSVCRLTTGGLIRVRRRVC